MKILKIVTYPKFRAFAIYVHKHKTCKPVYSPLTIESKNYGNS